MSGFAPDPKDMKGTDPKDQRTYSFQDFLDWRGIQDPCQKCNGSGKRAYPSTAVWAGGIGGASITSSVCDGCWGSGDADKPWPSWRELVGLKREKNKLEKELEELKGENK